MTTEVNVIGNLSGYKWTDLIGAYTPYYPCWSLTNSGTEVSKPALFAIKYSMQHVDTRAYFSAMSVPYILTLHQLILCFVFFCSYVMHRLAISLPSCFA